MASATSFETLVAEGGRIPATIMAPLRPMIIAGHAQLFRYAVAAERALTSLGTYVGSTITKSWSSNLNQPASSVVDLDYVKLYAATALLQYFVKESGAGDAVKPVYADTEDPADMNKVRWIGHNFVTYGAYTLDADFHGRECKVGDVVDISIDGYDVMRFTVIGIEADDYTGDMSVLVLNRALSTALLASNDLQLNMYIPRTDTPWQH